MMDTKKLFNVAKANGIDEIEVYSTPMLESLIEICSTNWLKRMLNV